ncbi:hypothetical protein F4775DRAFT_540062 [Biscogniauxia sp. FL1348]|nr:hypothetical protein F4775DRAFT_540062 [Biscogniauxia sp. FL1348]
MIGVPDYLLFKVLGYLVFICFTIRSLLNIESFYLKALQVSTEIYKCLYLAKLYIWYIFCYY